MFGEREGTEDRSLAECLKCLWDSLVEVWSRQREYRSGVQDRGSGQRCLLGSCQNVDVWKPWTWVRWSSVWMETRRGSRMETCSPLAWRQCWTRDMQHWEAAALASSAFPNQPAMQLQSNYLTNLGHSVHIWKMVAIYLPESGEPDASPI